jgi:hypothetical protein
MKHATGKTTRWPSPDESAYRNVACEPDLPNSLIPIIPFIRPYSAHVGDYFRFGRDSGAVSNDSLQIPEFNPRIRVLPCCRKFPPHPFRV